MRGDSTRRNVSYWKELQSDIVRERGADCRRRGLNLGTSLNGTERTKDDNLPFQARPKCLLTDILGLVELDDVGEFKVAGDHSHLAKGE